MTPFYQPSELAELRFVEDQIFSRHFPLIQQSRWVHFGVSKNIFLIFIKFVSMLSIFIYSDNQKTVE